MGGSEQLLYFDLKVVSRSWETLVCPISLMGEQETKVILILPAPARKHWEKGEVAWQQSRSQEEGIFFLQIQPIFSPSSLLKSREELFFLVVSCSAVKSRGSAASQKKGRGAVVIHLPTTGSAGPFGWVFLMDLHFFSAFCTDSAELRPFLSPTKPQPCKVAAISSFTALTQHFWPSQKTNCRCCWLVGKSFTTHSALLDQWKKERHICSLSESEHWHRDTALASNRQTEIHHQPTDNHLMHNESPAPPPCPGSQRKSKIERYSRMSPMAPLVTFVAFLTVTVNMCEYWCSTWKSESERWLRSRTKKHPISQNKLSFCPKTEREKSPSQNKRETHTG